MSSRDIPNWPVEAAQDLDGRINILCGRCGNPIISSDALGQRGRFTAGELDVAITMHLEYVTHGREGVA